MPGGPARQEGADGHELRFAVDYLSGYLLTRLPLPVLKAAAPSRIVNVSSLGQSPIDFDDVMLLKGYSGRRAYTQSKPVFTVDLAEEPAGTGVTANALHPATYMPTKMVTAAPLSELREGVEATSRLVTDPELDPGAGGGVRAVLRRAAARSGAGAGPRSRRAGQAAGAVAGADRVLSVTRFTCPLGASAGG